jgi:hypothetical protein
MMLEREIESRSVKHLNTMRSERGMALAVAIFALVIVGALVAGALFAGTQEQRVGESSRRLQQSFGVAEIGVNTVVRTWNSDTYNLRGVYPTDSVPLPNALVTGATPRRTGSFGGYVYRLNNNIFLIDVTGHDTVSGMGIFGGGRARQRMGMLARIKVLPLNVQASLTTGNSDALAGQATVNGTDQIPPGWPACGVPGPSLAGIRSDAGTTVSTSGSATIIGTPPVMIDPTVSDTTFSRFGDVTYAQLAARANITLPGQNFANSIGPAVANGVCNKTILTNWGDGANPTQPCGNYFPIIHITGDATINGDQGQGILLVDGDLSIQGGFQWFGVTIIQGTLKTAGGGTTDAHFWGATMVHDSVNFGTNTLSGKANINFSSCAVMAALNSTGLVAPMRSRGWVQLF